MSTKIPFATLFSTLVIHETFDFVPTISEMTEIEQRGQNWNRNFWEILNKEAPYLNQLDLTLRRFDNIKFVKKFVTAQSWIEKNIPKLIDIYYRSRWSINIVVMIK